jgi:hypothetical protein
VAKALLVMTRLSIQHGLPTGVRFWVFRYQTVSLNE